MEHSAPSSNKRKKLFHRVGDTIEVVGAVEHHEGTTGKLNALPTAKLTGQGSVVRQPVQQCLIRPWPPPLFQHVKGRIGRPEVGLDHKRIAVD